MLWGPPLAARISGALGAGMAAPEEIDARCGPLGHRANRGVGQDLPAFTLM